MKKNKPVIENNTINSIDGTSALMYCYQHPLKGEPTIKTETIETYKFTKKGKEILVKKVVITTTKTKYLNTITNFPLTTSDGTTSGTTSGTNFFTNYPVSVSVSNTNNSNKT